MKFALVSTVREYRNELQIIPWMSLGGYGLLIIFNGLLICCFLPASWQEGWLRFLLCTPLILFVAKDLACIAANIERIKGALDRNFSWSQRLLALVPPEFLAYVRLERAMWFGVVQWLLRRKKPKSSIGMPLTYLERGSYSTVVYLVLIVLFIEIPIDLVIASVIGKSSDQVNKLHWIFGLFSAYGFPWIMGDRWHVVGTNHHQLTQSSLELNIGPRGFGSIPLNAIAKCEPLKESQQEWCKRNGYRLHDTRKLTPIDAPNLVVLINPGFDVRLTLLQCTSGSDGPIFLYLDRPESLIIALKKHSLE